MILIGHCYGRLVVQNILITAKLHSEDWPGLYSSTSGIVFLDTPHHCTGTLSSKGMMDAIIEQYAECQIEDDVYYSLRMRCIMKYAVTLWSCAFILVAS